MKTIYPFQLHNRCCRWPQHPHSHWLRLLEPPPKLRRPPRRLFHLLALNHDIRKHRKRGIVKIPPELHLLCNESPVVVGLRKLHRVVVAMIRLHQHFTRQLAPTRAPGYLRQQLKYPLRRSKIRHPQRMVRPHNSYQRHSMNVMPLGDHLRPYQQVDLTGMQPRQQPFHVVPPTHRIPIHPPNARIRKQLCQLLLPLLRSRTQKVKMLALALRTSRRHSSPKPAVVAFQPLPRLRQPVGRLRHRLVVRHCNRTVLALHLLPTAPTDDSKAIPTPIQQQNHLLSAIQRRPRLFYQSPAEQLFLAHRLELRPHVHKLNHRQRTRIHTVQHLYQRIPPPLRIRPALQRRRRRPQYHRRPCQLRPHHRHVAPVVARILLLLVARIMLFIHNYEPQLHHRRKHRRPRSHHNPRVTPPNPVPLLRPLIRRQPAVQQCYLCPKRREHLPRHRRRQPNLRHQKQRTLPRCQRPPHGCKIDCRLPGPRHPV